MKKSTYLATAILAGALAQPAFAQDAEPEFFDGFYVGGHFGLDGIDDSAGEGIVFDTDGDGEYGDVVATTTHTELVVVGKEVKQAPKEEHTKRINIDWLVFNKVKGESKQARWLTYHK